MSTGTYIPMTCAGCGTAITGTNMVMVGQFVYHMHCSPPSFVVGTPVEPPLTADLLRLIVREEVSRLLKERRDGVTPCATCGGSREVRGWEIIHGKRRAVVNNCPDCTLGVEGEKS